MKIVMYEIRVAEATRRRSGFRNVIVEATSRLELSLVLRYEVGKSKNFQAKRFKVFSEEDRRQLFVEAREPRSSR